MISTEQLIRNGMFLEGLRPNDFGLLLTVRHFMLADDSVEAKRYVDNLSTKLTAIMMELEK